MSVLHNLTPLVYEPAYHAHILRQLLKRIQQALQPLFDLPLGIFYCKSGHDVAPVYRPEWNPEAHIILPDPYFYIATVAPRNDPWYSWIYINLFEPWLLEDPKLTILFSIHPGVYGHLFGRKEVNCHIFVPEIASIAKAELTWYADKIDASAVNCSGLPGAKNHFASCFNL